MAGSPRGSSSCHTSLGRSELACALVRRNSVRAMPVAAAATRAYGVSTSRWSNSTRNASTATPSWDAAHMMAVESTPPLAKTATGTSARSCRRTPSPISDTISSHSSPIEAPAWPNGGG